MPDAIDRIADKLSEEIGAAKYDAKDGARAGVESSIHALRATLLFCTRAIVRAIGELEGE